MTPHDLLSVPIDPAGTVDEREEHAVIRLLKFVLPSAEVLRLERHAEDQTLSRRLNFDWLCVNFPSFPFWMGCRKVDWQRDVFGELLKRFTKTPCYRAWESVREGRHDRDDRPVAVQFIWPHLGHCVLHNGNVLVDCGDSLTITRRMANEVYTIEPLEQFARARLDPERWLHYPS